MFNKTNPSRIRWQKPSRTKINSYVLRAFALVAALTRPIALAQQGGGGMGSGGMHGGGGMGNWGWMDSGGGMWLWTVVAVLVIVLLVVLIGKQSRK